MVLNDQWPFKELCSLKKKKKKLYMVPSIPFPHKYWLLLKLGQKILSAFQFKGIFAFPSIVCGGKGGGCCVCCLHRGQRSMYGVIFYYFSTLFFSYRDSLLLNLELSVLARLALLFCAWYERLVVVWLVFWVQGIRTQVCMLCNEHFTYWAILSSSSPCNQGIQGISPKFVQIKFYFLFPI